MDCLNWRDILKWRPNNSYEEFPQYKTKDSGDEVSRLHQTLIDNKTTHPVLVAGHYIFRGKKRIKRDTESYELHDWSLKILSRKGETDRQNWFYRSPTDSQILMFDITPPNEYLPQQSETVEGSKIKNLSGVDVVVFTTVYPDKEKPNAKWFNMWNEPKEREEKAQRINPFAGMSIDRVRAEIDGLQQSNQDDRNKINRDTRLANQSPKKQAKQIRQRIDLAKNRIQKRNEKIAKLKETIKQMKSQGLDG